VWELARTEQAFDVAALAKKHGTSGSRLHHAIHLRYFEMHGKRVVNLLTQPPSVMAAKLVCEHEAEALRESAQRCAQKHAAAGKFTFTTKAKPKPPTERQPTQLVLTPVPVAYVAVPCDVLDGLVARWMQTCTFEQLVAAAEHLKRRAWHGIIENPLNPEQTLIF
jgi:hypothetical protein